MQRIIEKEKIIIGQPEWKTQTNSMKHLSIFANIIWCDRNDDTKHTSDDNDVTVQKKAKKIII